MNLRTFLTISAVIALVYAVGMILVPGTMASLYGLDGSGGVRLVAQFFGVGLLTLGIINWLARDLKGESVRPVIIGSLIGDIIGTLIGLIGTLNGTLGPMGWSTVIIYLLLALGYAYFQFLRPSVRATYP
jgi:hypothetical protein